MSERSKRYRAFISYSQKDKSFARRLHQALEGYRLPSGVEVEGVDPKTRKLGRLFRDDDEMGAATDLGTALQGAIADAENLIVVCSPHAAKSRWVNEEVIHFKRTGRADRIFAVIVGGDPTSSEEQCFPPGLRFELESNGAPSNRPAEPLGLDLRKEPFNRLVVRLVAGLVQTPFDTLWKRERRRARARTLLVLLAASFLTVAVGATVTQSLWRPAVEAYWRYKRFAQQNSNAVLMAAAPGTVFQDCRTGSTDCPAMVLVPEGRFIMGSALEDPENLEGVESPRREIEIDRFAVSQTEITFAHYQRCFDAGACGNEMPDRSGVESMPRSGWDNEMRPVINVSWADAQRYVAWLSRTTGHDYRLLAEAEWEYAARAQGRADAPPTRFSWGNDDPVCQTTAPNGAAYGCEEWVGTWPGGSFAANAFGLHDMHGNVSEWVEDCYQPYDATRLDGAAITTDASGMPCSEVAVGVTRGGHGDLPAFARSASRQWEMRSFRMPYVGFRVARSIHYARTPSQAALPTPVGLPPPTSPDQRAPQPGPPSTIPMAEGRAAPAAVPSVAGTFWRGVVIYDTDSETSGFRFNPDGSANWWRGEAGFDDVGREFRWRQQGARITITYTGSGEGNYNGVIEGDTMSGDHYDGDAGQLRFRFRRQESPP